MKSLQDHGRTPPAGHGASIELDLRPRVVIFEGDTEPSVGIVELPESTSSGTRFCHCGTRWEVTATRTGDRVLIARPAGS